MTPRSTSRVALSQPAKDMLWSESGGHCQNPECRADLHSFAERTHIGEFAHIIPASTKGPRAEEGPELTSIERAFPENVILLCPNCHRMVDKAPDEYPADVLRAWKRHSQRARAIAFGTPRFESRAEARTVVEQLLSANRTVFTLYGPLDGVFDDTRADQWRRHVKDMIIPNNQKLMRLLQVNRELLTDAEKATADVFSVHAQQLEERHLEQNWTPGSIKFPTAMESILEDER